MCHRCCNEQMNGEARGRQGIQVVQDHEVVCQSMIPSKSMARTVTTASISVSRVVCLVLSVLPFSCALQSKIRSFAPATRLHGPWHEKNRHASFPTPLRAKDPNNDQEAPVFTTPSTWDPDQLRRRQILLSMLASAGVSTTFSIVRPSAGKAVETNALSDVDPINIIVPPLDDRDYLTYTLDNGLRVLLCSDPSSNDGAAAMDVHVGAFSDPVDVPGLAHFTEHMLFLGTKLYKKEDSFESFLASNGGSSNAYTDSLDTVYYFELEAETESKFSEGLKRFGSFFSGPLFTESATGRELNAIESENAKNLQSDTFRVFQMNKSRANPNHPFSKFSTGNKKTLLDDTRARNINLRQELVKFYNRYYSANQMTLAIVAPLEMDELKKVVQGAFSDIPNRNIDKPEEEWKGVPPFKADEYIIPSFQNLVEVVPVQDIRQVTMAWPIVYKSVEDIQNARLEKPVEYVAHLVGHEGPGSLLSYLKRRGWGNSVAAATEEELSDFETFEVVVGLTRQGLAEVESVVEAIYSYISLLRDRPTPTYVFDEVLQLEELQWRFLSKIGVAGYVQSLSVAMQKYPPALYLAGPRRLALKDFSLDPPLTGAPRSSFSSRAQLDLARNLANTYLENLTVDNALVTVISKSFESKTDRKEKWYGTDYRVRQIPSSTLDRWRNCENPSKLGMKYPPQNPFIPSEAGLQVKSPPVLTEKVKKRSFESRMEPIAPPRVIRDDGPDGQWTVFFKQDDRFGKPKGFLIFQIQSKDVFSSPLNAALSNLLELCVTDRLTEYAYGASLAGLTYDIKVLARGVRITFGGYNDKLMKFASYVARKLSKDVKDVLPKNDNEFDRYKDLAMRALSSFDVKQPYAHASYYANLILEPRRFQYSNSALRDATRKTTLPDLVAYAANLWASGKGEALVQGNFLETEALELVDAITGVLPFKPIPITEIPPRLQALPLPKVSSSALPTCLLIAEPNPSNENAVAHLLLQKLSPSDQDHVLIELISAIVYEPFYNELRTKQQLGYIVTSGVRGIGDSRTLTFLVQSSVAKADSLTVAILKFLDTVEENLLRKLTKGDVAVYTKSLIDRKTEPDKDLSVEVTRNWSEIASGRLQFDRLQKEAAALLDIEKEDLIEFWRKLYSGNGRRALLTQVIPANGPASSTQPPASVGYGSKAMPEDTIVLGIDDIELFRRDRERISGKWIEIVKIP